MRRGITPLGISALLLSLTLSLAASGCSGPSAVRTDGKAAGVNSGSGASVEDTQATAGPYSALSLSSTNEKAAAANLDKALKSYIEMSELGNKNNGTDTYIFKNEPGYKPLFVGYQVTLYTGKKANGKYSACQLAVLDNEKVTAEPQWQLEAGLTRTNGVMKESFFTLDSDFDSEAYDKSYTPQSAGEKKAVELAEKWMADNVADLGYKRATLTRYIFIYGQPGDQPCMLIPVDADGMSNGSNVTWPADYNSK